MKQDRIRWRDREMWVDVGEKTIVTTLECLWPKAIAILHFLLRKKKHGNRLTTEKDFIALLIQTNTIKTNMEPPGCMRRKE